jgi:hypothetical protein
MDIDSFTDLALRVLAREATEEEHRAMDAELASSPAYREKFDQLKAAHDILRAVAPMTNAVTAQEPELPAYRLNELRTAVHQHFGPATTRNSVEKKYGLLTPALRWLLSGGVMTALAIVVILMSFSDRSVEVGLYRTNLLRGGDTALSPADIPAAHLITFDQDAPFDQWKKGLAWNQHAKIWIDNENDLLHIIRRDKDGHLIEQTEPLAPTNREQSDQVSRVVESLQKR